MFCGGLAPVVECVRRSEAERVRSDGLLGAAIKVLGPDKPSGVVVCVNEQKRVVVKLDRMFVLVEGQESG